VGKTSFLGDGWNLDLESDRALIHATLMLVALGAPVAVRISLPAGSAASSIRLLADTLYADAELVVAALRIHQDQHRRVPEQRTKPLMPLSMPATNTVQTTHTVRAKNSSCTRRRR